MQVVKHSFPTENHFIIETFADDASQLDASQLIEKRLIGTSEWAIRARELILYHVSHDNTVNLKGELGTGKTLLAALIHQCSARREGPFVTVTFASASVDLRRSVLFGASQTHSTEELRDEKGLIELAREGTLYVNGLSHTDGSALLVEDILNQLRQSRFDNRRESWARILLGWTVQPGLCSSQIENGSRNARDFETVAIPPLRERPEDVEALVLHFVRQHCLQAEKEMRTVSPESFKALRSYDWPRNVLELKTLISSLANQASPPLIDVSLLPAYVRGQSDCDTDLFPASGVDLGNEIKRREIDLICAALKYSRGLQAKAAKLLRIKPTTLFMKIQRYGIDVEAFRYERENP